MMADFKMTLAQAHAGLTVPGAPFEMDEIEIRGVATRVWKNAPPTLREIFLASQTYLDREFMVHEDERVTFPAFGKATKVLAAEFQARGVAKGDRVAIVMRNVPEWPVAFYAAALIGAIAVPVNAWGTGAEIDHALTDSGATVVVADAERFSRMAERLAGLPNLKHIYVSRSGAELDARATRLEAVIGGPNDWASLPDQPMPDVALAPEDDATIFYTSGTTGRPKGALATHRNINCNLFATAFAQTRMYLRNGLPLPPADPHDQPQRVFLFAIPMFHVTGTCTILNPALATGSKLVFMRRWDTVEAMRLIEAEKITIAGGVPTIAWQIIEHPEREKFDLSSLQLVSYGGAPSAPDLARKIGADLKAVPGNGWGMTETSAVFTQHFGPEYAANPLSCGPAVAVGDLKIMDADGLNELPIGEVGELWAKGPQVVKGYWNNPAATAETFRDGWLRTGDIARLDADGLCYIVDRAKDMLIRGGENIYCIEVENTLFEHPAVTDAALVGLPCAVFGEQPAAVVVLKPGHSVEEPALQAFVRERLAGFKVPTRIHFHDAPLPRNANGKVLKGDLKTLFTNES